MNRFYVIAGALTLGVLVAVASVEAQGKKAASVKAVMKACHGKDGFRAKLQAALKEKSWDKASKVAKDYAACWDNMNMNEPKKGEKESWEKLNNAYGKALATLQDACKDEDAAKANGALGYIAKSCKGCHDEHK